MKNQGTEELKKLVKKYLSKISQLKSENFQLRRIIDNLPASIYWKNKEGAYLGFNKAGAESARKFNLPYKEKDVLGKTDHDLFPKAMADIFRANDLKVIETEKEIIKEETAILPSGERIRQLSTKKPLYDEKGNLIGIIGSTVDISIELKKKAEETHRLKMNFIRNMEHDIRTPFNGINELASFLYRKEDNQEKKELLSYIVNSARELLSYCNDILDFSKIESDVFAIVDKKFNVVESVKKIINMETVCAKQKNLDLTYTFSDVPDHIIGDDYRLTRILINLLSNALKFTSKGYVKFSIKGYKKSRKKIILKFTVEDTGIGFSEEQQRLVGEKFNRFTPSNKGFYKGLGLGLTVVKKFVNDMQGELELESELNRGSRFSCIIPFKLPLL